MRYFDDEGTELNPDLYPIPQLCMSCKRKVFPYKEYLCKLNRLGQRKESTFACGDYEQVYQEDELDF